MKKLLVCLLVLCALFSFAGCKKVEDDLKMPGDKKVVFTVDGQEYELGAKGTFRAAKFRENPYDFKVGSVTNTHTMTYLKEEVPIFQVMVAYFENETISQVVAEVGAEMSKKTIGNYEYQYYETTFDDEYGREISTHQYLYEFDNTTYMVSFAFSDIDTNLEQIYMENVYFEN